MTEEKVMKYVFMFGGGVIGAILIVWLIAYISTITAGAWSLLEPNLSQSLIELSKIIFPIITLVIGFVAGYGTAKREKNKNPKASINQ